MSLKGPRKHVLVVEDDAAIRELVSLRVDLAGHNAIPVKSGLEAWQRIISRRPHAMILDIGLPAMDGFEVLHAIMEQGWVIPTLLLTARNSVQDIHKAKALGAVDYLAKPFDNAVFLQKLERLLKPAPAPELKKVRAI